MKTYEAWQIIDKMEQDNRWLVRGLLAIYARQTADEQVAGETSESNGVGFNGWDAPILTGLAQQVLEWQNTPEDEREFHNPLSTNQYRTLRNRMWKYAGQLERIANSR